MWTVDGIIPVFSLMVLKAEEGDDATEAVDSELLCSLDEEELRMLASLKREQEEEESRASGLSASQIHQCTVGVSLSSEDASTWTRLASPVGTSALDLSLLIIHSAATLSAALLLSAVISWLSFFLSARLE